jgi:hypothetical protein
VSRHSTSVQTTASADLTHVILAPAQVGPGYRLEERPDGHGVKGYVTLDMCGFVFRSEALRTDRLQVNYMRPGSVALSNEVVLYQPGGARQALHEVETAIRHCPPGPVRSRVEGLEHVTYRIRQINVPGVLPGSIALLIHLQAAYKRRSIVGTNIAVYQVRGNLLSGIYTLAAGDLSAQERIVRRAAGQSAKNLAQT